MLGVAEDGEIVASRGQQFDHAELPEKTQHSLHFCLELRKPKIINRWLIIVGR